MKTLEDADSRCVGWGDSSVSDPVESVTDSAISFDKAFGADDDGDGGLSSGFDLGGVGGRAGSFFGCEEVGESLSPMVLSSCGFSLLLPKIDGSFAFAFASALTTTSLLSSLSFCPDMAI